MMESNNRRHFLKLAGATAVGSVLAGKEARAEGKPMRLGVVVWVRKGETPDAVVARVKRLGFPTCQIGFNELTKESAGPLKRALKRYNIEATALLELGPGRMVWDFYEGPLTIGLVPKATRRARIKALELAADVASECGIPAIHTHCGFIPMNPNNPVYGEVVVAVREIAIHCKKKGRMLWCETGQETPITLVRLMQDVGTGNLGINLDVANLILYDTGNPVDALDVFGTHVRGIHAKDGLFPTNPRYLGKEVPIGQGKVDFPTVIRRLKKLGYRGALTIERETEGPQQVKDILKSKKYLEKLVAEA